MERWGRAIYKTLRKIDKEIIFEESYRYHQLSSTSLALCEKRGLIEIAEGTKRYKLTKLGRYILFDIKIAKRAIRSFSDDSPMKNIEIYLASFAGQINAKVVVSPKFSKQYFGYLRTYQEAIEHNRERMETIEAFHQKRMMRKILKEREKKVQRKMDQYLNV
jgi:hypothetical protein